MFGIWDHTICLTYHFNNKLFAEQILSKSHRAISLSSKFLLSEKLSFGIACCLMRFVYVKIGNPVFCLTLDLTDVNFRGELQHVGQAVEQNIKCRPTRNREIAGVRL